MTSPATFDEAAHEVAREVADLIAHKNHDYGKNNILKFGMVGILVRASDKIERLINLQDKEPAHETVEDTWSDLAGYALLALMLMRGTFELPLKGE